MKLLLIWKNPSGKEIKVPFQTAHTVRIQHYTFMHHKRFCHTYQECCASHEVDFSFVDQ